MCTRHTDAYAATGFVHAGVLLALTEMAYARVEEHLEINKGSDCVAMQRSTQCVYHAPLPWRDDATIRVETGAADERGFEQTFQIRSALSDTPIATITHRWAWRNAASGRGEPIPLEIQRRLLRL